MNKKILIGLAALSISLAHADTTSSVETYRQKGYTVSSISPVFSQLLATSFPQNFKTIFENTKGQQYIREAVLEGEDEKKWTQMITVTGYKDLVTNPNVTPRKFVDNMAGGFKRACPGSFNASIFSEEKINGFDSFMAVLSCGTSPTTAGKTSESAIILAIKGEKDYYTIQWAERMEPSSSPIAIDKAKWAERFKKLSPIKLCPIVPGEGAPYVSCVGPNKS
jgi:hypothetical protein